MNDAILLAYTEKEFEGVVREALSLNSRHKVLALSESPLAQTSLVEDCFLKGERVSALVRGRTMQALLHWGIDQLRPTGEHSWTGRNWKNYNVLFYPYLRGMTFADLQKHIQIVQEKALFEGWRPKAIGALAKILRQELKTKANLAERQAVAIKDRCERQSADERTLLELSAIFREKQPIGQTLLYQLAQEVGLLKIEEGIGNLIAAELLQTLDDGTKMELHPAFHRHLQPLLSPSKRQAWHHAVAVRYQKEQDYLEAAYHFRRMKTDEGYALAAQTLINHKSAIINQQRMAELSQAVAQFRAPELLPALWCQLKIVAGDIALDTEKIESAIADYGQALAAKDIQTKAQAYYSRGKAYKRRDLDQALAHYNRCIELLAASSPSPRLLIESYMDKGWIFLQYRLDLEQAEQNLQQAQALFAHDKTLEAQLHNAWARFYAEKKNNNKVIEHRLQALLAAEESQNIELKMKYSKNLGFDYGDLQHKYNKGLEYLDYSQKLAHQLGDNASQGVILKDMGAFSFWMQQYEAAIEYYQQSYQIFAHLGHRNRQALVCADLCEAYAELGESEQAKHYFDEGVTLAKKQGHTNALRFLKQLAATYPGLPPIDADLNKRQLQGLDYVKREGKLTKQQYLILNNKSQASKKIAPATATRDLREMCQKGFLVRHGKGRGTYYTQPLLRKESSASEIPNQTTKQAFNEPKEQMAIFETIDDLRRDLLS